MPSRFQARLKLKPPNLRTPPLAASVLYLFDALFSFAAKTAGLEARRYGSRGWLPLRRTG